jgi:hypothetical protein
MAELGFSARWDGAIHLTTAVLLDFGYKSAKLRMIDAFRAVIPYSQTLAQEAALDAYFDGHRSGSYHAWNAAGKTGRPPAWPGPESEHDDVDRDPAMERDMDEIQAKVKKYGELLPELMERLERELATELLAVWEAFCGFCEGEMGFSAEKLLRATFRPALEDVAWIAELCERLELEADPEATAECWKGLAEYWQRVVERV